MVRQPSLFLPVLPGETACTRLGPLRSYRVAYLAIPEEPIVTAKMGEE